MEQLWLWGEGIPNDPGLRTRMPDAPCVTVWSTEVTEDKLLLLAYDLLQTTHKVCFEVVFGVPRLQLCSLVSSQC